MFLSNSRISNITAEDLVYLLLPLSSSFNVLNDPFPLSSFVFRNKWKKKTTSVAKVNSLVFKLIYTYLHAWHIKKESKTCMCVRQLITCVHEWLISGKCLKHTKYLYPGNTIVRGWIMRTECRFHFFPVIVFFFISVFSLVKTYDKIYFEEEASEKCLIINYYIFIHTTEIYIS